MNGQPINSWHQLASMTARYASEELVYSVERNASGASQAAGVSKAEITIPPAPMRSLGFWMQIGPVVSLQDGSIAAEAGLKPGDVIRSVDDLTVGEDIDPLRLPNYFADKAGETVKITIHRQEAGPGGDETKDLEIVPEDKPGWSEVPAMMNAPLPIPAIGAAFRVSPRIAKVLEGSEAAAIKDTDRQLKPGQRISRIVLAYEQDDALGTKGDENAKFEFDESDEDLNWAHVFYLIQQAPLRDVRVHIAASGETKEFSVELKADKAENDWYLPIRGIRGFEQLSQTRVAESPGEAISLGVRRTRNSIVSIYSTLRSLIRGDLSAKALSGPLGIISIGYQVADSGLAKLMVFLGLLSINLAVLNFLPIPVLDGGHMVFLIWEGVTRRKPSPQVIGWAHAVGLLFIISLFLFVMYLDVVVRFLGYGAE